jgi:hypothetical protein
MRKRITPKIKEIANAHIEARQNGYFDNPDIRTHTEMITSMIQGKTFEAPLRMIEKRYCSTQAMNTLYEDKRITDAYRRCVYKGFTYILHNYV